MTSEQLLIQFEKEERRERNIKILALILFFLTMTFALLSFALRPVVAHASTQACTYSPTEFDRKFLSWYDVNIRDNKTIEKYKYVSIFSGGSYWSVVYSDKPIHYSPESNSNIFQSGTRVRDAMIKESGSGYIYHTSFSDRKYDDLAFTAYYGGKIILSNYDVLSCELTDVVDGRYTNYKAVGTFFQKPLLVAESAEILPSLVVAQTREVIPIAVFFLACLIGLVGLRKGFRIFQR